MITTLYTAGARNILLWNIPSLNKPPLATSIPVALKDLWAMRVPMVNRHITEAVISLYDNDNYPGLTVRLLNIKGLMDNGIKHHAIVVNGIKYKFKNVTQACLTTSPKNKITPLMGFQTRDSNTTEVCSHPNQHLFWDDVHPTEKAQRAIAMEMESCLYTYTYKRYCRVFHS